MRANESETRELIDCLPGPIIVLGASGFIGAHLTALMSGQRPDIVGVVPSGSSTWRLKELNTNVTRVGRNFDELSELLSRVSPQIIFNLAAHGAYAQQTDAKTIIQTNLELVVGLAAWAEANACSLVQAGSSSEYGVNSDRPSEVEARPSPNSLYAISKLGATLWLEHACRTTELNAVTLRLYSVYGPLEDPGRLVPTLIREGVTGRLPRLANSEVSRDFVYVDDAIEALIRAAGLAKTRARGRTLNICTGIETTMEEVARVASREFGLTVAPRFGEFSRPWDLSSWVGDPALSERVIGWRYRTSFPQGFHLTRLASEKSAATVITTHSTVTQDYECHREDAVVSVIVACYRDAEAIPIMYDRVRRTLTDAGFGFELIFVNDASPDNSLEVIEALSRSDDRVVGVTHSRNFGSQAAFLSGMECSKGDFIALLDGDLQDPPELLPKMLKLLGRDFDVVYGHRVGREGPRAMRLAYKVFYRIFSRLSPFAIPRDAGDFCVMSNQVAQVITAMPEQDLFIRAQRAYVGFRQVGIDYIRPERMFGKSTNNFRRNIAWAMRGLLAVTRVPLTALTLVGFILFFIAGGLIVLQVLTKLFWPDIAPKGFATVSILILGMGAINILGISVVGEYVGRILDETKRRPRFVRRLITRRGVSAIHAGTYDQTRSDGVEASIQLDLIAPDLRRRMSR